MQDSYLPYNKTIFDTMKDHLNLFQSQNGQENVNDLYLNYKDLFSKKEKENSKQQQLTQNRLKLLSDKNLIKVQYIIKRPKRILTVLEQLVLIDCSFAQLVSIHFVLFGGCILLLSASQHFQEIIKKIDKCEITGCLSLSELGFGNNASKLQTTATYNQNTKQFVINSPTINSQKYFVVNGLTSIYAIVYARLINGSSKNEGVHAFLIQLQEEKGKPVSGIKIDSMGSTFGLKALNHARFSFKNVVLPKESLLDRYYQIQDNGDYHSKLQQSQKYDKGIQIFNFGRVCMMGMLLSQCKKSFNITLQYLQYKNQIEQHQLKIPVSPSLTNQNKTVFRQIIPLFTKTLCLNLAYNECKNLYTNHVENQKQIGIQLNLMTTILKCLTAYHTKDLGIKLVEMLGEAGLSASNLIYETISFGHWGIVGNGDNIFLMQQLCAQVIVNLALKKIQHPLLHTNLAYLNKIIHFNSSETLMDLLKIKEILLEEKLNKQTKQNAKSTGQNMLTIFSLVLSKLVLDFSNSYGNMIVAELCFVSIQRCTNIQAKEYLKVFFKLFMIDCILENIDWYIMSNLINKTAIQALQEDQKYFIDQILQFGFNISDIIHIPQHFQDLYAENQNFKQNSQKEGKLFQIQHKSKL